MNDPQSPQAKILELEAKLKALESTQSTRCHHCLFVHGPGNTQSMCPLARDYYKRVRPGDFSW